MTPWGMWVGSLLGAGGGSQGQGAPFLGPPVGLPWLGAGGLRTTPSESSECPQAVASGPECLGQRQFLPVGQAGQQGPHEQDQRRVVTRSLVRPPGD